jgi:hypothetical protein
VNRAGATSFAASLVAWAATDFSSEARVRPSYVGPAATFPSCPTDGAIRVTLLAWGVEDTVRVRCPYCREWVDLYVDPDTTGLLVEDCAVCCRPWTVTIERDLGRLRVQVSRAQ